MLFFLILRKIKLVTQFEPIIELFRTGYMLGDICAYAKYLLYL